MSRHRNIRTLSFSEEDDEYDDVYGHSVEDNYCISPGTVAQFTYDRGQGKHDLATYLRTDEDHPLEEISEENGVSEDIPPMEEPELQFYEPQMDSIKLNSCVEEIQNVVGNSLSESQIRDVVKKHDCNYQVALDEILNTISNSKPTVQKQPVTTQNLFQEAPLPMLMIANKVVRESISKPPEAVPEKQQETASTKEISVSSKSKTDEELLSEYNKARSNEKPLLNLVVIGHVDAGKSTLMGHLLFKLGHVSKKLMHKYKQESQKIGKSSFVYAWVLDETEEERSRGITTEVGQTRLETEHRTINLLDAPGHKDFIPYMITGASQADVAILVVDATKGEFETGFEAGGQTREHTLLIRSLGVAQLAVAVNKMDNVNWDKERFDEIVRKLSSFLKQAGFKESDTLYVPCSGLQGENLAEPSGVEELKSWYSGPCLLDVINNFRPPERLVTKPFRLCINDVFKGMSSGMCVAGKVEAGMVQAGDKLLLMPNGEMATAKTIMINESQVPQAFAGDAITMVLSGVDQNILVAGAVLCDPQKPIKSTTLIQARVVTFNLEVPLTQGFELVIHYLNVSEQAFVHRIRSQLHKSTGEVIKKHPRFLPKNSSGIIELETARPICIELYKNLKEMGRVMLRAKGSTIATGLVTKIY